MKPVDNKEQIQRIKRMERHLNHASKAIKRLSSALERYEEVQEDISALSNYYVSKNWKQDFADDEAGRLPANLKRGVLSEDGIWNLLEEDKELKETLQKILQN